MYNLNLNILDILIDVLQADGQKSWEQYRILVKTFLINYWHFWRMGIGQECKEQITVRPLLITKISFLNCRRMGKNVENTLQGFANGYYRHGQSTTLYIIIK